MNRHNDKDIKDLVSSFIDAFNLRPKYVEFKIRTFWKEEMSPMVNRYTTEIVFKNRILYVNISSATVKHELHLDRDKIKVLLNDSLEEEYIKGIVFR